MRDLVRDHVVDHRRRRKNQPPGEAQRAVMRAAAPARPGVAHRNPQHATADRRRHSACAQAELMARALAQKIGDATRQMPWIAADAEGARLEPRGAVSAAFAAMTDDMRHAEDRNLDAVGEGDPRRQLLESLLDPAAIVLEEA